MLSVNISEVYHHQLLLPLMKNHQDTIRYVELHKLRFTCNVYIKYNKTVTKNVFNCVQEHSLDVLKYFQDNIVINLSNIYLLFTQQQQCGTILLETFLEVLAKCNVQN